MRIGAHVSTAGGADKAIERARAMGAETIQIFGAAPQSWRRKNYQLSEAEAFRAKAEALDVRPVFMHGVYLVNLATSIPENLTKSVDALIHDMRVCDLLGVEGVIFHIGSHRGAGFEATLGQVADSIQLVLEETPESTLLILENSAGMGDAIGSKFSELALIMERAASPRLKVCLDTQHSFASGYDLRTRPGLDKAMKEFRQEIGLTNLVAVHANDSKCPLGGVVDRHENIGQGHIGREGFATIMGHPAFQEVPFLLEVPGIAGQGPDKENLEILKSLRDYG